LPIQPDNGVAEKLAIRYYGSLHYIGADGSVGGAEQYLFSWRLWHLAITLILMHFSYYLAIVANIHDVIGEPQYIASNISWLALYIAYKYCIKSHCDYRLFFSCLPRAFAAFRGLPHA
jgi:hypothetical protein